MTRVAQRIDAGARPDARPGHSPRRHSAISGGSGIERRAHRVAPGQRVGARDIANTSASAWSLGRVRAWGAIRHPILAHRRLQVRVRARRRPRVRRARLLLLASGRSRGAILRDRYTVAPPQASSVSHVPDGLTPRTARGLAGCGWSGSGGLASSSGSIAPCAGACACVTFSDQASGGCVVDVIVGESAFARRRHTSSPDPPIDRARRQTEFAGKCSCRHYAAIVRGSCDALRRAQPHPPGHCTIRQPPRPYFQRRRGHAALFRLRLTRAS